MSALEAELEEASKIIELYAHSWGARGHAIIEKNSMEFAAALRARAARIETLLAAFADAVPENPNSYPMKVILGQACGPLNPDSAGGAR